MKHSSRQFKSGNVSRSYEDWHDVHSQVQRVQKKSLEISNPGDADEQEADEVARKVVSGESAGIHGTGEEINRKGDGNAEASPEFQSQLNSKKGTGSTLDDSVRGEMESKMGADFSGVNIHTGSDASSMSESINAKAFTHGQDVFFKQGQYNPSSSQGKELLAHELVHTVQQRDTVQRQTDGNNPIEIFGTTNYRFDTYKMTGADLSDQNMSQRLNSLSFDGKLTYMEKSADYELRSYLYQTLIAEMNNVESFLPYLRSLSDDQLSHVFKGILDLLLDTVGFLDYLRNLGEDDFVFIVLSLDRFNLSYRITEHISPELQNTHGAVIAHFQVVRGNTAVINRLRTILSTVPGSASSRELITTVQYLPLDRQKVVLFALINEGLYAAWYDHISADDSIVYGTEIVDFEEIKKEHADPLYNTENADKDQRRKIKDIITPGEGGKVPKFKDIVGGRSYKDDIKEKLDKFMEWAYPGSHTDLGRSKYDWPIFESIANQAKESTDALYGVYGTGDALTHTGADPTLMDLAEETVDDGTIYWLVDYLINTQSESDITPWTRRYGDQTIHEAHNADTSRRKEKRIIRETIIEWAFEQGSAHKAKLVEIQRAWPAEAGGGVIFLQRFKQDTVEDERWFFWYTFQTMIHEYLHTLTDPGFSTAARKLGGEKDGILIEGGTSYFTDQVWNTIYPDEIRANSEMREKVEGAKYPYDASLIPPISHYEQIAQVREMVPVIGEENLRAAYFEGKTKAAGI